MSINNLADFEFALDYDINFFAIFTFTANIIAALICPLPETEMQYIESAPR